MKTKDLLTRQHSLDVLSMKLNFYGKHRLSKMSMYISYISILHISILYISILHVSIFHISILRIFVCYPK
jgi:hypothetical protein